MDAFRIREDGEIVGYGAPQLLPALWGKEVDWATPGIMAWYGSGDDGNINNGSERMPTFSASWTGTSFGWDGYYSSRGDGAGVIGSENVGNWGVALYLADISFVEKLNHKLLVPRYQGTNDAKMARYISGNLADYAGPGSRSWGSHVTNGLYLTTKDSVWEVNLNSTCAIYDNLELGLDLGYMNLKLNKANWGIDSYERNAYRVDATIHYSF